MRISAMLAAVAMLFHGSRATAQIPVEIFSGHEKTTLDIMFFKFFKNGETQNSNFLFFNRNRVSIDYEMTETNNLPQFSFTEAISYNDKRFGGFAPVMVASILNRGVYPKAGIQFAKLRKDYTFFCWFVSELHNHPNLDFFLLARFTPKLSVAWNLFSQLELYSSLPTEANEDYNLVQRFRLGLKRMDFQFGFGADFTSRGRAKFAYTQNIGVFLRYEF